MTALEKIKEQYLTQAELASLLGVTPDVIRDWRSRHKNGHIEFIPVYSPTSKSHLFDIEDVLAYIKKSKVQISAEIVE